MSEQKLSVQERRSAVLETANKIDEVASQAMVHFNQAGSMAAELQVAQSMKDMRDMLTAEVMTPIMSLMDTDLGFRTDRDPKQRDKNGNYNTPYSVDVIRDVVIEAKLRGFHIVGNEINVIAGRMYAAKNGLRRKLTDGKSFPGLSGFRDSYEVPRIVQDKGALIKCRAEWTLNGKKDSVELDLAIRVNGGMGADAIVGKAERKLCKRVHDIISGMNTPEGEIGEDDLSGAVDVTPPKEESAGPTIKEKRAKKAEAQPAPAPVDAQITGAEVPPAPPAPPEVKADPAPAAVEAGPEPESPPADEAPPTALQPEQQLVAEFVTQTGKADFDTFKRGMSKQKLLIYKDTWEGFHDIPVETCKKIMGAKKWALGVIDTGRE